ncbi:hypothetical protein GCM10010977_31580 [Citricoccus zhacaiensis]|uniref:Uncharacterized protein n=1 Tax=Citricoccus zhacaiensis TaxID=489142 RepID=A0ABQ2MC24_9MICC|nr:hypothetical protein GCM10010977_31580 [Citricoccus zhacaiensis]
MNTTGPAPNVAARGAAAATTKNTIPAVPMEPVFNWVVFDDAVWGWLVGDDVFMDTSGGGKMLAGGRSTVVFHASGASGT